MIDVFWDPRVLDHDTGSGLFELVASPLLDVQELHPENPERVRNMRAVLERGPIARHMRWHEGRLAEVDELTTVHDPSYIEALRRACEAGGARLTSSTPLAAGSWEPLLAAAGTCLAAADAVLRGDSLVSYALVRPPGHHAQPSGADGFCFLAHVALAVERARASGLERVAVVDWDVHHGNGTQEIFYSRADVLTVSAHMRHGSWGPSHPQTGSPEEIGIGEGAGFNVNLELGLGAGDAAYAQAFEEVVVPILRRFRPELIVGACGQDASTYDPNGRQNVTMRGFRRIGALVGEAARELCGGRIVLIQEGGYARTYSAYCLHSTLEGILGLGEAPLPDPIAYLPDDPACARADLDAVRAALSRFWQL